MTTPWHRLTARQRTEAMGCLVAEAVQCEKDAECYASAGAKLAAAYSLKCAGMFRAALAVLRREAKRK